MGEESNSPQTSSEGETKQRLKKPVTLGINIFDTERMNPMTRAKLLKGKVDLRREAVVDLDPDKPDERVLPFNCPLVLASLVVDMIRNDNRIEGDQVCRAYIRVGDGQWKKLHPTAVLTRQEDGVTLLNEDLFPIVEEAGELIAPVPQRVLFSKRTK